MKGNRVAPGRGVLHPQVVRAGPPVRDAGHGDPVLVHVVLTLQERQDLPEVLHLPLRPPGRAAPCLGKHGDVLRSLKVLPTGPPPTAPALGRATYPAVEVEANRVSPRGVIVLRDEEEVAVGYSGCPLAFGLDAARRYIPSEGPT